MVDFNFTDALWVFPTKDNILMISQFPYIEKGTIDGDVVVPRFTRTSIAWCRGNDLSKVERALAEEFETITEEMYY